MKKPELPEIVHVQLTIDDGWDWNDNPAWHHEERKIPYKYLVFNGSRSYSAFNLTQSETKRKEIVKNGWIPENIINRIEDIHVIEYQILQELENLKGRMNKYNFHPTL